MTGGLLEDRVAELLCQREIFQAKRCYSRKKTRTIKIFVMLRNEHNRTFHLFFVVLSVSGSDA